jgi:hypothetical protein
VESAVEDEVKTREPLVMRPLAVNVPVAVTLPPRKVLPETSKRFEGEVVPMPTKPLPCWTRNWLPPTEKPPVLTVEVAVVEVAVIYATVGLVEALIVVPLDESHPCPNEV